MLRTLTLAFGAAALLAGAAQAQNIGIAVSNPGSIYHSSGSAIAKVANEAGLQTTIQPATAPTQYIPVVANGDIDIGLCNIQELREALLGEQFFTGRPNPNLRMVAVLYPLRNGIWVRKDSPYKTVADLKGKPVASGYTAQKTVYQVLKAVLATAGMTTNDIKEVPVPTVVAAGDAFASGKVESFVFAIGAAKVREVDAAVGGLRSLPIENSEKSLKAMREHFATAQIYQQMPGPGAPGILEPTYVLAYPAVMFASSKTPDDVVYKLAKVLSENKANMQKIFPPFALFDANKMYADAGPIQYHPGALKFYKEKGLVK